MMPRHDEVELITTSPAETERLGRRLGALLPKGSVVALQGELASGKTCLVRGMAAHFGHLESVASPTFTIINQYGTLTPLYHLDLYRLEGIDEVLDLGYEELFEPDGVTVIEWAERALPLLPEQRVDVFLEHAGGDRRRITLHDYGVLPHGWQAVVTQLD
jgi:tRNA threonylcarbamoyladenosine biosynthesis protein TsaE